MMMMMMVMMMMMDVNGREVVGICIQCERIRLAMQAPLFISPPGSLK